jgi:hypothetical protein
MEAARATGTISADVCVDNAYGQSGAANCNHPPEYVARGHVSVGDCVITPGRQAIARMVPDRMPNENGATVE